MNNTKYKYTVSLLQKNNFINISNALPEIKSIEDDGAHHWLVLMTNLIDNSETITQVERGKNRIFFITSERFIFDEKALNSNITSHRSSK